MLHTQGSPKRRGLGCVISLPGTWFGETSRQSQAEPVKQQHTGISPNHVPEEVRHCIRDILGPKILIVCGLAKFVPAVSYHFCLNLPAACNIYIQVIFSGPVQTDGQIKIVKEILCEYRVFFRPCHDIWATKSERELRSALARKPCRKLLTLTLPNLDRAKKMSCIFFMWMRLRLGICRISIDRGSPKRAPIGRP